MEKCEITRICVGCRESFSKDSLFRIVRTPGGRIELEKNARIPGRGCYLCRNSSCLKKALGQRKKTAFEFSLKCPVGDALIKELERSLDQA